MIGKIIRAFSNDWKKLSAQGKRKGKTQRTQRLEVVGTWEGNGRRDATRMSRMPLRGFEWLGGGRKLHIERIENRCADRNGGWDAGEMKNGG